MGSRGGWKPLGDYFITLEILREEEGRLRILNGSALQGPSVKTPPPGALSRVLKRKALPQRMSDWRRVEQGPSPRVISVCSLESWWGERGTKSAARAGVGGALAYGRRKVKGS